MHFYFCCVVLALTVSSSIAIPAEFFSSYSTKTITSPFVLTAKASTATSAPSSDSIKRLEPLIVGPLDSQKRDACFCTYEYQNTNISAYVDGEKLLFGSNLKKGDTAQIACLDKTAILTWRNGLCASGPVSLTCDTCQTWDVGNMPSCVPLDEGNTWIVLNQQMKLLPGGTVEIRQNEYVRIQCSTVENKRHIRFPEWRSSPPKSVDVIYNTALVERGIELKAFLHIDDFQAELTGRYECSAKGVSGQLHGATILNLKIGPPEVRCPILDKKGIFIINYSNGRKVNSTAIYFCRKQTQATTGGNVRTCLDSGEWSSEEDPSCIDISCPKFRADRYLDTQYTNEQYVGSVATFLCRYPQRVFGSSTSTCLRNGTWSHSKPTCQLPSRHFRCPLIYEKGVFIISYSNRRNMNSIAYYNCKRISQKIHGSNTRTCQQNGEWSGSDPVCVDITCSEFWVSGSLTVSYTNENKAGSNAEFHCIPPAVLVGSSTSKCLLNGTWSDPQPYCHEPAIRCPAIEEKGIFTVRYNNDRIVGSAAYYSCREPDQNMTGSDVRICQDNGEWSGIESECMAFGCEMEDLMASLPTDSVPNEENDIGELLPPALELKRLCNTSGVAMRDMHPFPTSTNYTRGLPDSWNLIFPPPA